MIDALEDEEGGGLQGLSQGEECGDGEDEDEDEDEEKEEEGTRHRRVVKARAKPEEVIEIPRPAITRETRDKQSTGGGGRVRLSQGASTHWQA